MWFSPKYGLHPVWVICWKGGSPNSRWDNPHGSWLRFGGGGSITCLKRALVLPFGPMTFFGAASFIAVDTLLLRKQHHRQVFAVASQAAHIRICCGAVAIQFCCRARARFCVLLCNNFGGSGCGVRL